MSTLQNGGHGVCTGKVIISGFVWVSVNKAFFSLVLRLKDSLKKYLFNEITREVRPADFRRNFPRNCPGRYV